MSIRTLLLSATAALATLSTPALAQKAVPEAIEPAPVLGSGDYDGSWSGDWESPGTYRGTWQGTYTDVNGESVATEYVGVFDGDTRFVSDDGHALYRDGDAGWHEEGRGDREVLIRREIHRPGMYQGLHGEHGGHYMPGTGYAAMPQRQLGYSASERDAWLMECRDSYYGYDRSDAREDGTVIGGLLGAAAGGLVGNRIADGDRLAGTLIGAGVGGIAGALIGAAIGAASEDDRDLERGLAQCEDYLRRWEAGQYHAGGYGYGYGYGAYGYGPVMMMRVPIHRERRRHSHDADCYEWVEEEVAIETAPPAPQIRRTIRPRASKLTPVN